MSQAEGQDRVVVVGAGIIGLSIAFFLHRSGLDVVLVHDAPLDESTACGSAGAIAASAVLPHAAAGMLLKVPKWLFDPLGPLAIRWSHLPHLCPWLWHFLRSASDRKRQAAAAALAALHRNAFEDFDCMLADTGLAHLLRKQGQLVVYGSESALKRELGDWELCGRFGYSFEFLSGPELRQREPTLGAAARCGLFDPHWAHFVDPKALLAGIADRLRAQGVEFVQAHALGLGFSADRPACVMTDHGQRVPGGRFVIAAGAWSAEFSSQLGDPFPLESERGYNTMLPDPGIDVQNYMTFAQEHFVLTPMTGGLRIGGAAELAGTEAPPNFARSDALLKLAKRYLPDLRTDGGTRWMGHRPQSPDTVPVIDRSRRHANVFYAFGHGHLGLTGGPSTGRIVTALIRDEEPGLDLRPYRIDRFR